MSDPGPRTRVGVAATWVWVALLAFVALAAAYGLWRGVRAVWSAVT